MRQNPGREIECGIRADLGPCYYYQKQFFSGKDHPLSRPDGLMHYDLKYPGSHRAMPDTWYCLG